ncbi:MAG: hypothetical protein QM761_13725 [Pseudoxanthomonas sp.]
MFLYLILAFACAAWFWLSLHPGSFFGFALTGGDWIRLSRNLDNKQLQTRPALRAAGHRSISTHLVLIGIGATLGIASGKYTLIDAAPALLSATLGFAFSYLLLLWSTRPRGWYGVA